MPVARNNDNNLFNPRDGDGTESFRMKSGERGKSIWPQTRNFFGSSMGDGNVFRKHAELMINFRKSHVLNQDSVVACLINEPILHINNTASETGGSKGPYKEADWLFRLPESKVSMRRLCLN
jgi:hypothetical protein